MKENKLEIMSLNIDGLFEEFTYDIKFDKDINILTSPNGFGKSTILRIIYNFSNANYHSFFSETFNEITFHINRVYEVSSEFSVSDRDDVDGSLNYVFLNDYKVIQIKKMNKVISITDVLNQDNKTIIIDMQSEELSSDSFWSQIDSEYPYLNRVSYDQWENEYTGEIYNKEKLLQLCGDSQYVKRSVQNIEWIEEVTKNLRSYYITTDRIRVSDYSGYDQRSPAMRRRSRVTSKNMINLLAAEVKTRIQDGIRNQFEIGRRRETTFPQRLIKSLQGERKTTKVEDVMQAIKDIQSYEDRFSSLGILSDNAERTTEQLNQFFSYSDADAGLTVLKVYLDDIKSKFKVLDNLATMLTLFKESVNNLLSFKALEISFEKGFVITSNKKNTKELDLSSLSSGEQHLIVMIGKLVFGATKGDVVLIDEPEISFHPEWQEVFIDIINKIRSRKDFKVIMATHSPILIGGRWDDVIELAEQHK
ncbi:AAA family ATPase [Klebsiella pneumoniae]|jgi:predicted ATP-binding protein involved in virulence|uniref:AAA family ATPase n=1 Tax=Klebsiella pneumoniae TaxID=573 RepID=UPI0010830C1A|nr:AAA family ATPase [Klebsiella pneumoniae]DAQ90665.1 MAG TPA: AAA domain protein [Caudoviricetes sp.]MDU9217216.1 AAA family ATPase [Klebsiella pneumoniae]VGH64846.1 SMC domain-containing protein [Klebsiella pneumoniae]HBW5870580.1 ATP-binding protein [Klebsiella pneumoniae]HCB0745102.1 ATP-binding protein [Klebsiella pneumoniae]